MKRTIAWMTALSLFAGLGCGSAVRPGDGSPSESGVEGGIEGGADVPTPIDDRPASDTGVDNTLPLDDVLSPDVFTAETGDPDVVAPDVPIAMDVVTADTGVTCTAGATDSCPTTPPGPCANLSDGAAHTITFTGFRADVASSCETGLTSSGADSVVPLTLTAMSDVVITAQGTGGDVVVAALYSAAGCGMMAGEMRCASSVGGGGTATVRLSSLAPGTYYVVLNTGRAQPVIVQAMITPPRPRVGGDTCPGVVVVPDGPAVSLNTMGFATDPDIGTQCGSRTASTGFVDSVFQYTLTATRDVTINVTATGFGNMAMDVATRCARSAAIPGCSTGSTIVRTLRSQAPGTYFIVVDYQIVGMTFRSLVASITTGAPTMAPPGDACPGLPLTMGVLSQVTSTMLGPDFTMTCDPAARGDAAFTFTAPATGNDVIVNVQDAVALASVSMQLQSPCGGAAVGPCIGPPQFTSQPRAWRRYPGLTAGTTYTVVGASNVSAGAVGARYYVVPAATPAAVTGNDRCAAARVIPEAGGVFTGSTTGLTDDVTFPLACLCFGGHPDVVYTITLTARRRLVASTLGSALDTGVIVQQGAACPGAPVANACSNDAHGSASEVDVVLDPGTYYIVLKGCSGLGGMPTSGTYALDVVTLPP